MNFFILQFLFALTFLDMKLSAADEKSKLEQQSIRNPDPNVIFPMVTLPLGQLRGQTMKSRGGKLYYAYRGIPYAEPPNRFEMALPSKPWEELLDGRQNGSICPQIDYLTGQLDGSENCLFLNIDFPHYDRCQNDQLLPVMFNIHGGGLTGGAGVAFGSPYLMDECIVFVSINYRLGALGFASTGDDEIPGNLGLKDQVLALNFTKNYINYFRGDPDLITIMGISAGGVAVSHLVASPMTKGLFAHAISSSGTALNPFSIQEKPLEHLKNLAIKLNCSIDTTLAIKMCLKSKDLVEIITHQADGTIVPFGPTLEPVTAVNPFQTIHPGIRFENGDFNHVPLIAGFVQDEGITLSAASILNDPNMTTSLNEMWNKLAPKFLWYDELDLNETELNRISQEIWTFYFGNGSIGQNTRQQLTNLFSDRNFIQGVFDTVELHSKYAPVYPYVFTYKGGASSSSMFGYEVPVVSHGDDGQFMFDAYSQKGFPVGSEGFQFSKQFISHWVNFARTGVPGGPFGDPWTSSMGNQLWHQLDVQEKNLINYLQDRRNFWKNLGLFQHEIK